MYKGQLTDRTKPDREEDTRILGEMGDDTKFYITSPDTEDFIALVDQTFAWSKLLEQSSKNRPTRAHPRTFRI